MRRGCAGNQKLKANRCEGEDEKTGDKLARDHQSTLSLLFDRSLVRHAFTPKAALYKEYTPDRAANSLAEGAPDLRNHGVDAVLPGHVPAAEEEFEIQPGAEADHHWIRYVSGSSGISVGQQLTVLVHGIDTILPTCVPATEEKFELLPVAESDHHWIRNVSGSSGIPVGQQF